MIPIVSNAVALLDLMTALASRIELGSDFPIIVKPISIAEITGNTGHRFSFVVRKVVHHGNKYNGLLKECQTVSGLMCNSRQICLSSASVRKAKVKNNSPLIY